METRTHCAHEMSFMNSLKVKHSKMEFPTLKANKFKSKLNQCKEQKRNNVDKMEIIEVVNRKRQCNQKLDT